MKIAYQLSEVGFDRNSIVTIGSFDGIHRAHTEIVREVVERAHEAQGRSVVVTFDPHPREVVGRNLEPIELLTTVEERIAVCEQMGVDVFLVIRFDYPFSQQTPREFYEKYLVRGTGVSSVILGYDHHFGRNREGSREELQKIAREFGFAIKIVDRISIGGIPVSSSTIRHALKEGNTAEASRLLGRPYSIRGTVMVGDRRGGQLGYPTANIRPDSGKKLVPRNGIYLVNVHVGGEQKYGMMSIGTRPTFVTDGSRTLEVNILDFDRDIYHQAITVEFLRYLREEQKFDSIDALIQQMHRDKETSLHLIEEIDTLKNQMSF